MTHAMKAGAWCSVLAVAVLWVGLPRAQSGRVDTGLKLRMSDTLEGRVRGEGGGPAQPVAEADDEPARVRGLSLALTGGMRFDDNILRSNQDEQRDAVVTLLPRVYLDGGLGRHELRLGYEGDLARYQRRTSENHFNHGFLAALDLDLERRLKVRLTSGLNFGTDQRGDLDARVAGSTEPDRWRRHRIGGDITLGRRIARAQLGLGYEVMGIRYLNNSQELRDFDRRTLKLSGRYNLGPRFSVVAEASGAFSDYLDLRSTLDSSEYRALAGVAWEATAKTTGEVKVGLWRLDFDTPGIPSVDGFTWDARLSWAPRTFSQFTAYSSRSVSESGFTAGSLGSATTVADTLGVRWRHGLSNRLRFEAGLERTVASFQGAGDDEFIALDVGVRYRVSRLWEMVARYDYDSRSSATPGGDYEAGTVFFGFELNLDRRLGR